MACRKEDSKSKSTDHISKDPGRLNCKSLERGNSDDTRSKSNKSKIKSSGNGFSGSAGNDGIDYGERYLKNRTTGQNSMDSELERENACPESVSGPTQDRDSVLEELLLLFTEMRQVGLAEPELAVRIQLENISEVADISVQLLLKAACKILNMFIACPMFSKFTQS